MRIYNYLFYKTYILAKHSRNFDDIPVLGGIIFVIACVMFNLFSIFLVLERIGNITIEFNNKYKYPFALALVISLLIYYSYKGRYKKIIERYEEKEQAKHHNIHPIFVIILYYIISSALMFFAGLYKNQDWIFSK